MPFRSFFSTFLGQSQFKYANILNSELKSYLGNVWILLPPKKLDIIHHLGTIEPWQELTKQNRLNLLSTCIIDRASIFANHNNQKIFQWRSMSQFKTDKNIWKQLQNKKFWHKGRAMANLNKKYLANSDHISVNFSESQLKPTILLSDLNREYNFLLELNWLDRKMPKKTT